STTALAVTTRNDRTAALCRNPVSCPKLVMDLLRASAITVAHPPVPSTIIRTWSQAELRRLDDFTMVMHLAVRLRLPTSGAGPCRRTQPRPLRPTTLWDVVFCGR